MNKALKPLEIKDIANQSKSGWLDGLIMGYDMQSSKIKKLTNVNGDYLGYGPKRYQGAYVHIPSYGHALRGLYYIKKAIQAQHRNRSSYRPTLLDIGCGTGDLLDFAYKMGYITHGIEMRKKYSKYWMGHYIVCTNAMKVTDFPQDVLYMYRPMNDNQGMFNLLKHILNHLSCKQVLVANYCDELVTNLLCKHKTTYYKAWRDETPLPGWNVFACHGMPVIQKLDKNATYNNIAYKDL